VFTKVESIQVNMATIILIETILNLNHYWKIGKGSMVNVLLYAPFVDIKVIIILLISIFNIN
jgi:hypothetical protein